MDTTTENENQVKKDLRCYCPLCWRVIDLDLDRRGKPYWFCGSCQVRSFGSRNTLDSLMDKGLAWSEEPPLKKVEEWLDHIIDVVGLKKKKD